MIRCLALVLTAFVLSPQTASKLESRKSQIFLPEAVKSDLTKLTKPRASKAKVDDSRSFFGKMMRRALSNPGAPQGQSLSLFDRLFRAISADVILMANSERSRSPNASAEASRFRSKTLAGRRLRLRHEHDRWTAPRPTRCLLQYCRGDLPTRSRLEGAWASPTRRRAWSCRTTRSDLRRWTRLRGTPRSQRRVDPQCLLTVGPTLLSPQIGRSLTDTLSNETDSRNTFTIFRHPCLTSASTDFSSQVASTRPTHCPDESLLHKSFSAFFPLPTSPSSSTSSLSSPKSPFSLQTPSLLPSSPKYLRPRLWLLAGVATLPLPPPRLRTRSLAVK